MFGIGMPELIVVFVIALLVFGPKELPKIGKTIGKAMGEFRRASDELRDGIQREIEAAEREADTPGSASPEPAPAASSDPVAAPTAPAETVPAGSPEGTVAASVAPPVETVIMPTDQMTAAAQALLAAQEPATAPVHGEPQEPASPVSAATPPPSAESPETRNV